MAPAAMTSRQPVKDPLDDLEAILTSFCKESNPIPNNATDIDLTTAEQSRRNVHFSLTAYELPQGHPVLKGLKTGKEAPSRPGENARTSPRKRQRDVQLSSKKVHVKSRKQTASKPQRTDASLAIAQKGIEEKSVILNGEAREATSSDEAESARFLAEMKRLAKAKHQAARRRQDVMKSNMLKRMRELAATSESKTRQLAVTKSKNISGLSALKKLMPKSVDKIVDEVERVTAADQEQQALLVDEEQTVDTLLEGLETKLRSNRMRSLSEYQSKEKKLLDATARVSLTAKGFSKTLTDIERSLKTKKREAS